MRYKTELDYMLKIRAGQGLPDDPQEGKTYEFYKTVERNYVTTLPILLADDDLTAVGKVWITEFTTGHGITTGKFKVLKVFDEKESAFYTSHLKENFDLKERIERELEDTPLPSNPFEK